MPHLFVSDNGKTFKAASRVINGIVSSEEVQKYLSHVNIKWHFNLAKSPWWGGIFERLIRSTKRCLRKVVGLAKLTYDELLTTIAEIESVINSRPLSYRTPDDLEEPLTPSHLLVGRRVVNLPDILSYQGDIQDSNFELNPAELSKRVKHLNNALNQFWRCWRQEYLIELREAHRFGSTGTSGTPVALNELVMLHEEGLPRGFWRLAKIEDLIIGRDGRARGAKLKVSSRDGTVTTLQRPLSLLFPLEISCPKMPAVRNESIVDTQQEETQVSDGQELDVPQAAPTIR